MKTRWLDEDEILNQVNPALRARGWAELNLNTCRVMGAFHPEEGHLIEFLVLQLYPILGPMLRVDNEHRDAGQTTQALVSGVEQYLKQENARGFMVIAESALTRRLCEGFGMTKLPVPVYMFAEVKEESLV